MHKETPPKLKLSEQPSEPLAVPENRVIFAEYKNGYKKTAMAKVGYIYKAEGDTTLEENREWMESYGCVRIMYEEPKHEKLRPEWKHLMNVLGRNDELVLAKFSNALRSSSDLTLLLDYCRINQVRIISIGDRIDSEDKLFPRRSTADIFSMIGTFPEEAVALRTQKEHLLAIRNAALARVAKVNQRSDRERTIINMYEQNYSIDDIWAASGYAVKCSVYNVLNRHGVTLNRGRFSGPRKKKEK